MKHVPASITVRLTVALLAFATGLASASTRRQAIGMAVEARSGTVLRAGDSLPLPLTSGELLFAGDTVRAAGSEVRVLYCPSQEMLVIAGGGSVTVGAAKVTGRVARRSRASVCVLPEVDLD